MAIPAATAAKRGWPQNADASRTEDAMGGVAATSLSRAIAAAASDWAN